MWQSHAFGGALSFGSSVPADQGTVSACPAVASNPPATIAPMALRKPRRASMEPSSRGAKRRGDPESQSALRSPGLLRFARNDDGGSVQSQHSLERRSCLSSLRSGGSPLTGAIRLRQSRAASKSRTRDLLADKFRAKMPFLRVLPNEQNELQIGESRKHSLAPQFGAFAARRQVAALDV